MLRIALQHVEPKEIELLPQANIMWEAIEGFVKKIVRPDTEVTQRWIKRGTIAVPNFYFEMYNNLDIVEGVIQAEREGYDAVVICCAADPGLQEARSVVNIPVIGVAESSYCIASMLGQRAAVVTVFNELIPSLERTLRIYGFESRMIRNRPIRSWESTWDECVEQFTDPHKSCIPRFDAVAKECVNDGADVIINGCAWTGPAFTLAGYDQVKDSVVPIINPVAVGLKMAESLADLQKSVGLAKSQSTYIPAPEEFVTRLRKVYELGS
ncbi:MAG: hypothetical protein JRI49_07285 [Deltaproteobacteria bacterium]|nr:hypothetical protein [Deltaproteobacteria bacterium]